MAIEHKAETQRTEERSTELLHRNREPKRAQQRLKPDIEVQRRQQRNRRVAGATSMETDWHLATTRVRIDGSTRKVDRGIEGSTCCKAERNTQIRSALRNVSDSAERPKNWIGTRHETKTGAGHKSDRHSRHSWMRRPARVQELKERTNWRSNWRQEQWKSGRAAGDRNSRKRNPNQQHEETK
jgi:hypothetical protein